MEITRLIPKSLSDYSAQLTTLLQSEQDKLPYPDNLALREILRNKDIERFSIKLFGEETCEEADCEEDCDINLKRKIEQYNRISKPNRGRERSRRSRRNNQNQSEEGKPRRKVRTTITPAKLEQMNRIFKDYLELQHKQREEQGEDPDEESDKVKEMESLKSIGEKLGLGYSTILHKFREFRATKKVKGGALIAALNQKRKYKKSKEIEELILKSLGEGTFYTAVELANHIKQAYGRTLSRSIISRHLGEMGYSYKNVRSRPCTRNSPHVKELRRKFGAALALLKEKFNYEEFFLDQFVFSLSEMPRKPSNNSYWTQGELYLTILTSPKAVVKYELRTLPMFGDQFERFLVDSEYIVNRDFPKVGKVIVMDMDNPLHFSDGVMHLRREMQSRSIRLFYLPPQSAQLSLLEWALPQVKESLMGQEYESLDDLKQGVDHQLKILCGSSLQPYFQQAESYLHMSIAGQNF